MTTTETFAIPPCCPRDEESALGSAMHGADKWGDPVGDLLTELPPLRDWPGWPGWFLQPECNAVYDAIERLHHHGEPVTPATVSNGLRRAGKLDSVGGEQEIQRIFDTAVSAAECRGAADLS